MTTGANGARAGVPETHGSRSDATRPSVTTRAGARVVCGMVLVTVSLRLASAQPLPAGTRIRVRLDSRVSSMESRPGDTVRAHVIAAEFAGSASLLPSRTPIVALVQAVDHGHQRGARHVLALEFRALGAPDGGLVPIRSRVDEVHDARESLDSAGHILGLPPPVDPCSRGFWALMLLASAHPAAAVILFAALDGVDLDRHRATTLGRGTDLTLVLQEPAWLPWSPTFLTPPPIGPADSLVSLVSGLPRRAQTQDGREPADLVNLVMIGELAALDEAFARADWSRPDAMGMDALFNSLVAEAAARGYERQPMSTLLVDGTPPVRAFQRINNTFAKRHHLRLWRTTQCWHGSPVWVGAGTHDVGILFSAAHRTFSHRVDPRIDLERNIIAEDLIAADAIVAQGEVPVVPLPGASSYPDHAPIETDNLVRVLELRAPASSAAPTAPARAGDDAPACAVPPAGGTGRGRRRGGDGCEGLEPAARTGRRE